MGVPEETIFLSSVDGANTKSALQVGEKLEDTLFLVDTIEVWGMGGSCARVALQHCIQQREVMRELVGTVDRSKLFATGFDRSFLVPDCFRHQQIARGYEDHSPPRDALHGELNSDLSNSTKGTERS
jgi:hypothetical protein